MAVFIEKKGRLVLLSKYFYAIVFKKNFGYMASISAAGSNEAQSRSPIFNYFIEQLWPYTLKITEILLATVLPTNFRELTTISLFLSITKCKISVS